MTKKQLETTARGFYKYGTLIDLDQQPISVVESSLATEPAVRIFIKNDNYAYDDGLGNKIPAGIHLSEQNAKELISALQTWLQINRFK